METAPNIVNSFLTKGLPEAFKSMIMPLNIQNKGAIMSQQAVKPLTEQENAAVLDPFSNPEAFVSLWTKAAESAAKKAVAENAALGIDSPCTENGQTGFLKPNGKFVRRKFVPQ